MYHRIVYAADLSKEGELAARKAWELANQFDARLFLVHVIECVVTYTDDGAVKIDNPDKDKAKLALERMGAEYGVAAADQILIVGDKKTEILQKAEELEADLIVFGSHSLHDKQAFSSSMANAILLGAKCDAVVVRFE